MKYCNVTTGLLCVEGIEVTTGRTGGPTAAACGQDGGAGRRGALRRAQQTSDVFAVQDGAPAPPSTPSPCQGHKVETLSADPSPTPARPLSPLNTIFYTLIILC